MNKKKIYIANKVTGEEIIECALKFRNAATIAELSGWTPINPIEVVNDWKCPWDLAMRKCIAALMECDAIYLLPDWRKSKGANIERNLAALLELEIIEAPIHRQSLTQ